MKFNILEKLKEIFFKKSEYKIEKTEFNISEKSMLEKSSCSELDLNKNQKLIDLLEKKGYIEDTIINLKTDIKYYSAESQYKSIEELKNELKLYGELNDFLSEEINKVTGSEIEKLEYITKEYTMKDDLKLKDGSFIKGGTSFFVEGFKNGEFEVHFEAREENTYIPNDGEGSGYYFSEHEISRYSDLDKTVDLVRGKELINDNIKLEKNNSKDIKDIVEDASKKAKDYNNKLEKKEGKINEKEL